MQINHFNAIKDDKRLLPNYLHNEVEIFLGPLGSRDEISRINQECLMTQHLEYLNAGVCR